MPWAVSVLAAALAATTPSCTRLWQLSSSPSRCHRTVSGRLCCALLMLHAHIKKILQQLNQRTENTAAAILSEHLSRLPAAGKTAGVKTATASPTETICRSSSCVSSLPMPHSEGCRSLLCTAALQTATGRTPSSPTAQARPGLATTGWSTQVCGHLAEQQA